MTLIKNTLFVQFVALALFLSLGALLSGNAVALTEGKDYQVLETPLPVDNPKKIEVREFFWYGCPHCFSLEKDLKPWKKTLPKDVSFIATPAVLGSSWEPHARAFFVAEALDKAQPGKGNEIKAALFDAMHVKKKRLRSKDDLAEFFETFGVSETEFSKLYESFAVRVDLGKTKTLGAKARLSGVPAMIVNGKYLVGMRGAGGSGQRMLQIVDALVKKEQQARQ